MYRIILSFVGCLALPHFPTVSHKRHDFRTKVMNTKCVFIPSTGFVWDISHYKKNSARYNKCTGFSWKEPIILVKTLMKLEISRQNFEKYSNIKFHENPSSRSWVVACGRTDGWTDVQTGRRQQLLFAILRTRLETPCSANCTAYAYGCFSLGRTFCSVLINCNFYNTS
jgi:hypothetical protein